MKKTVIIDGQELVVVLGNYQTENSGTAMRLETKGGMPYANVTVNIPECSLPESMLVCKTWSENRELFYELVKQEVLIPTEMVIPCGHSMAIICKLNPSYKG